MGEMHELKVFTVAEANRCIPHLTELIDALRRVRERIHSLEVEIDMLELISEKDIQDPSSAAHAKLKEYHEAVDQCYRWIDEIHEMGCFLKDIETGLVDFYAKVQGRIVYLCWKYGESEINCWHEVGRGYSYRQPLEAEEEGRESSG